MKYFIYKLNHDGGQICIKTSAHTALDAIKAIEEYELCPRNAIELYEIVKPFFTMTAKTIFNKRLFNLTNTITYENNENLDFIPDTVSKQC